MSNFIMDALSKRENDENEKKEQERKNRLNKAQQFAAGDVTDEEIIDEIGKKMTSFSDEEKEVAGKCIEQVKDRGKIQPVIRNQICKTLAEKIGQDTN